MVSVDPLWDVKAFGAAREWATQHGHPQPDDRMLVAYGEVIMSALAAADQLLPQDVYTEVEYQFGTEQRTVWVGPWETVDEDENHECEDIWHLVEYPAAEACPTCGYCVGGDDEGDT